MLIRVALAVCVVLQLSEVAHVFLVRHEICAEHGETVHVSGAHSAQSQSAAGSSARPLGVAISPAEGTSSDGHEHCPFTPARSGRALVLAAAHLGTLDATVSAIAPPCLDALECSPSALRLLAPKTSPPV